MLPFRLRPAQLAAVAIAPVLAVCAGVRAAEPLAIEWDLCVRHEFVADAAFVREADTSTLRLRLGLRAELGHGCSALIEGEGIAGAGNRHNNGANGRTLFPAVIDADGAELNRAWPRRCASRVGRRCEGSTRRTRAPPTDSARQPFPIGQPLPFGSYGDAPGFTTLPVQLGLKTCRRWVARGTGVGACRSANFHWNQ